MLPGISGIELAGRLHESGYADVPMIASSASKELATRAAQSEVFVDAVDESFDLVDLLDRVQHYLPDAKKGG